MIMAPGQGYSPRSHTTPAVMAGSAAIFRLKQKSPQNRFSRATQVKRDAQWVRGAQKTNVQALHHPLAWIMQCLEVAAIIPLYYPLH
jgi:hypothetical protein